MPMGEISRSEPNLRPIIIWNHYGYSKLAKIETVSLLLLPQLEGFTVSTVNIFRQVMQSDIHNW